MSSEKDQQVVAVLHKMTELTREIEEIGGCRAMFVGVVIADEGENMSMTAAGHHSFVDDTHLFGLMAGVNEQQGRFLHNRLMPKPEDVRAPGDPAAPDGGRVVN